MKDEIIQGLWQVKDDIAAEYNHDAKQLVDHLRTAQDAAKTPAVDLRSRNKSQSEN